MTPRRADVPDPEPGLAPRGSRIDLHCHSAFSPDGVGTLDEIAAAAVAKGIDGVCLTEHDTTRHHPAIDAWNEAHQYPGFRFYPGVEVSTGDGHVLAIGRLEDVAVGLGLAETVQGIQDQGAVAVPAHPWRWRTGVGETALATVADAVPAIEVWNAQDRRGRNLKAASWCVTHRVGGTGGSDCHQVHDVGNGYTEFRGSIERLDQLLAALRSKDVWGVGGRTPWPTLVRQGSRNLGRRLTGRLRHRA